MGKSKERKIKKQNKQKEKMNQKNESNIRAFNLKQFQEINGNNFNNYTPQPFQNIMGRSYMPTDLFQNIQNAQLHKQEGQKSSGGSSSSQNK